MIGAGIPYTLPQRHEDSMFQLSVIYFILEGAEDLESRVISALNGVTLIITLLITGRLTKSPAP